MCFFCEHKHVSRLKMFSLLKENPDQLMSKDPRNNPISKRQIQVDTVFFFFSEFTLTYCKQTDNKSKVFVSFDFLYRERYREGDIIYLFFYTLFFDKRNLL